MKKLLLLIIASCPILVSGQFASVLFDFETPAPYIIRNKFVKMDIEIPAIQGNIWQVGKPQKQLFDSAAKGMYAAVTDTLNTYPTNNYSYFDVVLHDMGPLMNSLYCVFSFTHRYNTTVGKDGGYIMVSTDNRKTWGKLIGSNNQLGDWSIICNSFRQANGVYKYTDTLENGQPAFSGTSNGWVTSSLMFGSLAVKAQPFDSLIFRFVFESDSIADSNDGWMIDGFFLSETYTSGMGETGKNNTRIYPNPATNYITVQSVDNSSIQSVTVKDMLGRTLISQTFEGAFEQQVNLQHLPQGSYMAEVRTEKGISVQKISVQ